MNEIGVTCRWAVAPEVSGQAVHILQLNQGTTLHKLSELLNAAITLLSTEVNNDETMTH